MSDNSDIEVDEEIQEEEDVMDIVEDEIYQEDVSERKSEQAMEEEKPNPMISHKQGDKTCATYTFNNEDHTLGNA